MIGEALALTTPNCGNRPLHIGELARVVAKIELRKIAMQVLLCAVLIHAAHSALEDREITLNRIRRYIAAGVFFVAVLDRFVRRKLLTDRFAAPLDQRDDRALISDILVRAFGERPTAGLELGAPRLGDFAVIGFVNLNYFAFSTEWRQIKATTAHSFHDAMMEKPCGVVLAA